MSDDIYITTNKESTENEFNINTEIDIDNTLLYNTNPDLYLNEKTDSSDVLHSDMKNDSEYGILPTVTIKGLNPNESLKELVYRKQLLRGYIPSSQILNRMEARVIRFNPNLSNSHTIEKILDGKHEFQKDDLCYLPHNRQTENQTNTNGLIATIANFLYPVRNNDNLLISSGDSLWSKNINNNCLENKNAATNSSVSSFSTICSIDTSIAQEIENTLQNARTGSVLKGVNDNLTCQTPEGMLFDGTLPLTPTQITLTRNGKLLNSIEVTNNNTFQNELADIQLEVPLYYRSVSKYQTAKNNANNDDNTNDNNSQYHTKNLNSIYSYVQKIGAPENGGVLGQSAYNYYQQQQQLLNEQRNEKKNWFLYAWNAFKQFWVDLWEDLTSYF
ncbi:hypothetical protein ACO0SA_003200 [Hanseniaspora valbyensis]